MQMQILNTKLNVIKCIKYFCVCRTNECVTRTLYRYLPVIITTAIQNDPVGVRIYAYLHS